MRKISLSVTLFVMVLSAFSQSVLDKIPPSPTVASIIGAGEITTSKFTGTPNISIPLYQVGFHNMGVPISLSYNAQGIRVNDVPGWVGANWSLNAGGVITRTTNGLADDAPTGYFALHAGYESTGVITTVDQLKKYDAGIYDGAPDIYNFSFPGGSGKFLIDHNKEIHVFPHQKMEVKFIDQVNKNIGLGFTIRTLDGTLYTFDETETTSVPASGDLAAINYVSAFYLKSIESPIFPGKAITFDYSSFINLADTRKLKSYSATRRYYSGAFVNGFGPVISERFASYSVKRLEKIDWGTGSVEFIATSPRADLPGENMLDTVRIKDDSGNLIKGYSMTYDYYTGASGKLRLDQLQEFDKNGLTNPPHHFTYNEAGSLPAYNDTGQDFWGYYNGKSGNQNLLARQTVDYEEILLVGGSVHTNKGHYAIGNANREADEAFLKYGILTTIQYPTGGTSNFEYEINRYSSEMSDSLGFQEGLTGPIGVLTVGTGFANEYDYLTNTFGKQLLNTDNSAIWADAGLTANTQSTTFTTTDTQKISFSFTLSSIPGVSSNVKVEQSINGVWELIFDSSSILVAIPRSGVPDILFRDPLLLKKERPAGTYRITSHVGVITPVNGELPVENVRTQINAFWYIGTGITDLYGPGLRIKQISQKESATSAAVNIRRFEYTDENGHSTGALYASPIHSYRKFMLEESEPGISGLDTFTPLIVQSTSSSFSNYGADLGYSRVTELIGAAGENGKVIDEYRVDHRGIYNELLILDDYSPKEYPFAPSIYSLWDPGDLLKSTVYRKKEADESGDEYKKVQQTVNTYAFQQGAEVKGVAIGMVNPADSYLIGNSIYQETKYKYRALWTKLVKAEQTVYTAWEAGQTTVTELNYEPTPGHLQVKSQSVTGSDGRKTISEYTYPADYSISNPHPYAAGLQSVNMHGAVIEELNLLEYDGIRQVLGGKMTKYDSTVFQPEEIFTLKAGSGVLLEGSLHKSTSYNGSNSLMDSLYESRITFGYRDGNLVEQLPTSGTLVTYVWGYGNQYPVAKVLNASYADVEALLSPGQSLNFGLDGLTPTQANDLRNNLPGALATTQTYQFGYGMKTQTDSNGLITKYFYDAFGRLKLIKDPDDNIIQTFKYNYKGQ